MSSKNPSDSTIHLLQLTDLHLLADPTTDYKGCNTQASFDAVVQTVQQQHWPPDAILLTGDLVQDNALATYTRLAKQIQTWDLPVYGLPGNHDVPAYFQTLLANHNVRLNGQHLLGCHTENAWHLIMLDSTQRDEVKGHMASDELSRLANALATQTTAPTLICLHHPPVLIGSDWLDELTLINAEDFWDILLTHQHKHGNIAGVLCGHIHQELNTHYHGIPVWGTPSTCRQFKPFSAEFAIDDISPGYRIVELHSNHTIETTVWRTAS